MFVYYHEGHEKHKVEIIIFFYPFMVKIQSFTISSLLGTSERLSTKRICTLKGGGYYHASSQLLKNPPNQIHCARQKLLLWIENS